MYLILCRVIGSQISILSVHLFHLPLPNLWAIHSTVICWMNVPSSPPIVVPIWLHDKSQREGMKTVCPSLFVACRGLVLSDARCGIHFPDAILIQFSHSPNRGLFWYSIYILFPFAISRSNSNSDFYMSTTLIHILWLLILGKTVFNWRWLRYLFVEALLPEATAGKTGGCRGIAQLIDKCSCMLLKGRGKQLGSQLLPSSLNWLPLFSSQIPQRCVSLRISQAWLTILNILPVTSSWPINPGRMTNGPTWTNRISHDTLEKASGLSRT